MGTKPVTFESFMPASMTEKHAECAWDRPRLGAGPVAASRRARDLAPGEEGASRAPGRNSGAAAATCGAAAHHRLGRDRGDASAARARSRAVSLELRRQTR